MSSDTAPFLAVPAPSDASSWIRSRRHPGTPTHHQALEHIEPSGPVMLARVVAVAHAFGEEQALSLFEQLDREHGILQHPLTRHRAHAIRAHLREATGDSGAARVDFLSAAEMTQNDAEAQYLFRKASGGQDDAPAQTLG